MAQPARAARNPVTGGRTGSSAVQRGGILFRLRPVWCAVAFGILQPGRPEYSLPSQTPQTANRSRALDYGAARFRIGVDWVALSELRPAACFLAEVSQSVLNPKPDTAVESHPCAKNAQGWGTYR